MILNYTIGVKVSMNVCVNSSTDWQPVQYVPCLTPCGSWDVLPAPELDKWKR